MGLLTPFFVYTIFIIKTIFMDIKKIIKQELIKEVNLNPIDPYRGETDPTKVLKNAGKGDAGSAEARSEYLRGKIEKNFSSLGVYNIENYMEEQGIFHEEMIKNYNQPFDFGFMNTKTGDDFDGKATYNEKISKRDKTIVLDFINNDGRKYRMTFDPESLKRPFLGKTAMFKDYKQSYALFGLQINGVFNVIVQKFGVGNPISPTPNSSTTGSTSTQKNTNKPTNQALYDDSVNFFKFLVNNKKFFVQSPKKGKSNMSRNENFYDDLEDLLLLEKFDKNQIPKEEIKILKIEIPYTSTNKDNSTKKGSLSNKKLQLVQGVIKFKDSNDDSIFDKNIKKNIQDLLNTGSFYVRLSQQSNDVLIFSKTNAESGDFFTVKKDNIKSPTDPNQWVGDVEVGNKAMGYSNFKGSQAVITSLKLK